MTPKVSEEDFIQFTSFDIRFAAQSLIAASSIMQATADQYAHTGQLSVGAIIHASNVVDNVIERLGLAEIAVRSLELPF